MSIAGLPSNDIENDDGRRQVLPTGWRSLNGAHDVHSCRDLTKRGKPLSVRVASAPEVECGLCADADEERRGCTVGTRARDREGAVELFEAG